jgi:hypothetical protein
VSYEPGTLSREELAAEIIHRGVGAFNVCSILHGRSKETVSYIVGTQHGWSGGSRPCGQVTPKGVGVWAAHGHRGDPRTAELFLTWREIIRIVQQGAIPEMLDRFDVLAAQRRDWYQCWQDRYYHLDKFGGRVCLYKVDVVEREMQDLGTQLLDRALEIEFEAPARDDQLLLF